jgi:hypothetical protein
MYLFDLEEYNCNAVPNDWEDYATGFRASYDAYMGCISRYLKSMSGSMSASDVVKLNDLLEELTVAYNDAKAKVTILLNALSIAPLNCLNKTLVSNYMSSYSEFKMIAQKINVILTTGGDAIAINPQVGVDLTTITPTQGKTTKCEGVYMKQMDNGSEFRGKITQYNRS